MQQTSRLLANSAFTREHMKTAYHIDTPICYYGVDNEVFGPNPELQKESFVISVGELTPRKGYDFLVESLGKVPTAHRPQLRIACNYIDPLEEIYVKNLADQHRVELIVLKNLDADELANLYNQALLCLYAPVSEPLGLVPLEAMACGTPVIGVKEGGVPETVIHEKTGLLVERHSGQFAEALRHLLKNHELRERYGRQARKYVLDKWTWEKSVSTLEGHLIESTKVYSH
jgi:glycosyltransferase involved in cell wall biosynthesis